MPGRIYPGETTGPGPATFRVPIAIGREQFTTFEALVDTSVSYLIVPSDVLDSLGLEPEEERRFTLADRREVSLPVTWARMRLEGREQPTIAVFGEPGSEVRLGRVTLVQFGLAVDGVNKRLIRVPGRLGLATVSA